MTERERRDLERYQLKALATIESQPSDEDLNVINMLTLNISGKGAYLNTVAPLTIDTDVKVEVLVNIKQLGMMSLDGQVLLLAEGKVLRTDENGMAVMFNNMCEVMPIG